ncbi:hypothetical protein [Actinomadura sp. NPDC048394]|uniref:hypothetical protein n=1 Tax=Actinomadura sp. NPDC048394 TaxID=3158223 RepID=UPI003400727E
MILDFTTDDPGSPRYGESSELPAFLSGNRCVAQSAGELSCERTAERALWMPNRDNPGPFPVCLAHADRQEDRRPAPAAYIALVCPNCGAADEIAQEAEAVRITDLYVENGVLFGSQNDDWTFTPRRTWCKECGHDVTLPGPVENCS